MNYQKPRGEAVRKQVHWARTDNAWTVEMKVEAVRRGRPQNVAWA